MEIRVEYYGVLREVAGVDAQAWPLPAPQRVDALLTRLRERYPDLARHLPRLACAVGDEIVARDHVVKPGDVLALLPPVSGG